MCIDYVFINKTYNLVIFIEINQLIFFMFTVCAPINHKHQYLSQIVKKDTNSEVLSILFICGAFGRGDNCGGYLRAAPRYEKTNSRYYGKSRTG